MRSNPKVFHHWLFVVLLPLYPTSEMYCLSENWSRIRGSSGLSTKSWGKTFTLKGSFCSPATFRSVLDISVFFSRKLGTFIPSCSHYMYNMLIINDLYINANNICSHLYSHALITFRNRYSRNLLVFSYIFFFISCFGLIQSRYFQDFSSQ